MICSSIGKYLYSLSSKCYIGIYYHCIFIITIYFIALRSIMRLRLCKKKKKCKCPYRSFFSCLVTTMVFIRDCSPGNGFNVLSPGDWGTQTWDISGKPQALLPIKPRGPLWLCKAVKDIPKIDDQSLYFRFINKYQMSIKCKRYKNRKTCKNVKQKVT